MQCDLRNEELKGAGRMRAKSTRSPGGFAAGALRAVIGGEFKLFEVGPSLDAQVVAEFSVVTPKGCEQEAKRPRRVAWAKLLAPPLHGRLAA